VYGLILLSIVFSSVTQASEAPPPDPEKWYLESYGAMWVKEPWNNVNQTSNFYASELHDHEPEGKIVTYESVPWMAGLLEMWKNEGWLSSEITNLRVTRINASTTSFISRWDDHYQEAEDDYSCGWYLADLVDGQWKFTNYATIDCAEHGL